MGRQRARAADPLTAVAEVQAAIDLTTQARAGLTAEGAPPLDGIPDIRPLLERCRLPGAGLDGPDLAQIVRVLDAGPRLAAYGRGIAALAPAIAALLGRIPRLSDVRDRLRTAIEDDGSVTDRASARLGQVRRELRDRRRRLVSDLERLLQAEGERVFADRFVTLRHGRYVVPVRADARHRVRGIVHDRSQSSQTVFVEPEAAVEPNNDLVQLARDEEQEVARILAALTDAVRERADDVAVLVDTAGEIDWVFARAHTAERMAATAPVVATEGRVALRRACHPLLLAQAWADPSRAVVPADIELGPERPLLLVTGPNAGGKTIALKTLALLSLMAQVGCHVPAADGSRLPVFDRLFAIIGDEQSVAENLSTFSAFIRQIREVLSGAGPRSLVLLDELGAGTDPDEGAALARAILEALDARGALVMATTHLEPLRAFASTHPRARNASVEFDTETLAPTFRLRYDRPGPSYALAIAARLGLASDIIMRAETHRSEHAARLSELLAQLDARSRVEAEKLGEIDRRDTESAARLAAARRTEQEAEARARSTLDRARAEAQALLGDVRRAVSAEWERLKRTERSRPALQESRRRLQEAAARSAPPPPASTAPHTPLTPGSAIVAEHLGLRGHLVAINGDTATVQAGAITVRVPASALRAVPPESGAERRGAGMPGTVPSLARNPIRRDGAAPASRAIPHELLLLGRTTDEASDMVEQYLDDAFMAGLAHVRLVHGKGTGALRKAVRALLAAHPLVESFRDGEPSEGGAGATVAALRAG
jgi:DNA mismatch repair protein MutS2